MSIYEYDEKLHEKTLLEIGREEGREEGIEEGRQEGIQEGIQKGIKGSVAILKKLGLPSERIKEQLAETYNLSEQEAEQFLKQNI